MTTQSKKTTTSSLCFEAIQTFKPEFEFTSKSLAAFISAQGKLVNANAVSAFLSRRSGSGQFETIGRKHNANGGQSLNVYRVVDPKTEIPIHKSIKDEKTTRLRIAGYNSNKNQLPFLDEEEKRNRAERATSVRKTPVKEAKDLLARLQEAKSLFEKSLKIYNNLLDIAVDMEELHLHIKGLLGL